jgi:hypothetical protein
LQAEFTPSFVAIRFLPTQEIPLPGTVNLRMKTACELRENRQ